MVYRRISFGHPAFVSFDLDYSVFFFFPPFSRSRTHILGEKTESKRSKKKTLKEEKRIYKTGNDFLLIYRKTVSKLIDCF